MAREKYSIDRQEGKEPLFEYAAGLFGDSPKNLKTPVEPICQNILEAEIAQHLKADPYERTEG